MRKVWRATLASLLLLGVGAAPVAATPLQPVMPVSSSIPPLIDELGRPTKPVLDAARHVSDVLPTPLRTAVLAAVAFYEGTGSSAVALPQGGPGFTQFIWPSVAGTCIDGTMDAVGSAIAVPGPAEIPAPGAAKGDVAFLFTALGTSAAAGNQVMAVSWFNLNNFRWGRTPLQDHGINPEGPATVSGTAHTGTGTVVAVVSGAVGTKDASCNFFPTAAIIEVK